LTPQKQVASALKTSKYLASPPKPVNTATETPPIPKNITNPYFVVKKAPEPPKHRHKKKTFLQTTYLKIRLSSYWNNQTSSYPEALTAVLMEWGRVIDVLCSRDPKGTAVLPWSDRDGTSSLITKDSVKPLTKDRVAKVYTDDFFLSKRQGGMYLRFRLGHNRPIAFYLESDEVQKSLEEGCTLYIDKIQDSNVSIPGWGAGPVIGRGSLEDIEEMLKRHPLMVSNKIADIEIRIQQVRLKQGIWVKGEPRPVAAHFFVRARDAAKARKILNSIYPSKPRKEYPGGVQWRFVTNVADPFFPRTPRSMKKAESLRAKQEQLQKDIVSVGTPNIRNLHHCLEVAPYVTLAQVLMNWRSAKEPEKLLFLHVEQDYEQTQIFFHSRFDTEARQLVPLLPLILEQQYGPRAWNWFYDTAKDFLGGYEYDLDTQKVTMKEEDINADVDKNWEQSPGDVYYGDLSDEEDDENFGLTIDIGNIVLDSKDERQRILDDASVASMKSTAEALRATPQGWTEEQDDTPQKTDITMKEAETDATSSLSTTVAGFDVDKMNPKDLELFMKQAAEKLKKVQIASSNEDGGKS
jgi:hypothetical protein